MKRVKVILLILFRLLSRYKTLLTIFVLLLLLSLLGILYFKADILEQSVSEGMVGTYTENNLPPLITNLTSEGLVRIDQSGKAVPNLITGWQVNSDSTVYTVTLKDNLYWSDGTRVRASDIALSVADTDISTPDDKTIVIKLSDPFSPLPSLLDKPILKKNSNLGLGPYQISRIDKSGVFVSRVILSPIKDNLPKVVVHFYSNEKTLKSALRLGEVQSILGATQIDDDFKITPYTETDTTNFKRLVTIFYNTKDSVLSDKNFRLALSYAAPSIKGEILAKTPLSPSSWAFNPNTRVYLDSPDAASSSLAKVKDNRNSIITLTSIAPLERVGDEIVGAWERQDIRAQLRVESGIPQNFQALLIYQDIPSDPDQYSLWHSTQTQTNISGYSSPRIDKDLEDARKILSFDDRKAKYQDFQKVLMDESPATFLYFPKYSVVSLSKVKPTLDKVLKLQLYDLGF